MCYAMWIYTSIAYCSAWFWLLEAILHEFQKLPNKQHCSIGPISIGIAMLSSLSMWKLYISTLILNYKISYLPPCKRKNSATTISCDLVLLGEPLSMTPFKLWGGKNKSSMLYYRGIHTVSLLKLTQLPCLIEKSEVPTWTEVFTFTAC